MGKYISDGFADRRLVQEDEYSHCVKVIQFDHHEIHEGDAFVITDVQQINTTTVKWVIQTADSDEFCNLIFKIRSEGEITFILSEGSDRTGTNLLTPVNRNRNSSKQAKTRFWRAYSAGSTDGNTIYQLRIGSTTNPAVFIGGEARGDNEFILKRNTQYILSIQTFANVYVNLEIDIYEHAEEE